MSQYETSREPTISGWVVGGITFAGTMLILIGMFQAIDGLVAIFNDDFFLVTQNYTFDLDVTAWGWIHLLLGIEALHLFTTYYLEKKLANASDLYGVLGLATTALFYLFLVGRGVVWAAELNAVVWEVLSRRR